MRQTIIEKFIESLSEILEIKFKGKKGMLHGSDNSLRLYIPIKYSYLKCLV